MSVQYSGKVASVQTNLPTPLAIANTTDTAPIVVTTSAPIVGMMPGDRVSVTGAQDPAANGPWTAGTVTSNEVVLLGSTGTLAGGAQGTILNLNFGVSAPVPSDGDEEDNASIAPILERLSDQNSFCWYELQQLQGVWELLGIHSANNAGSFSASVDQFATATLTAATYAVLPVTGCEVGDVIRWSITCMAQQPANNTTPISGVQIQADPAVTVGDTSAMFTGMNVWIGGVGGVSGINGDVPITVIDATHIGLATTTGGTYAAGTGVVVYNTPNNYGILQPIITETAGTTHRTDLATYVYPILPAPLQYQAGRPVVLTGLTLVRSAGTVTISIEGDTSVAGVSTQLSVGPWAIDAMVFRQSLQ